MFQIQIDFDENKAVSVAGYSAAWEWNRKTVTKFLEAVGVKIVYPENTKSKQNQRGTLAGTDHGTEKGQIEGQIKFIDINKLKEKRDRSRDRKGTDQMDTNIDPIDPNPKIKKIIVEDESSTTNQLVNSEKKIAKKKWCENDACYQLSIHLVQRIKNVRPNFVPRGSLQMWSKQADLMLRVDKRDFIEAKNIINWIFTSNDKNALFWQSNILSIKKLREKFDQLALQMKQSTQKQEVSNSNRPDYGKMQ